MQLGLISDTHGTVPNAVHEALAGVGCILHAGDVGSEDAVSYTHLTLPTILLV